MGWEIKSFELSENYDSVNVILSFFLSQFRCKGHTSKTVGNFTSTAALPGKSSIRFEKELNPGKEPGAKRW